MSKTIKKQGIQESLEYCTNGTLGVSSHISKTSSKKDIEEKLKERSKVFKTIVKQYTERGLGHCAQMLMSISKSNFEK